MAGSVMLAYSGAGFAGTLESSWLLPASLPRPVAPGVLGTPGSWYYARSSRSGCIGGRAAPTDQGQSSELPSLLPKAGVAQLPADVFTEPGAEPTLTETTPASTQEPAPETTPPEPAPTETVTVTAAPAPPPESAWTGDAVDSVLIALVVLVLLVAVGVVGAWGHR